MSLTRRGALALAGAGLVAGCTKRSKAPPSGVARHRYGSHRDAFGDLYLPKTRPRGTVVLLHGGFWLDSYDLELMEPIGRALAKDGWAAWNLEYRRLGSGGGWPATFEDVAAGIDKVADLDGLNQERVVLLGHSAGGHLAVWAASRDDNTPGGSPAVKVRGAVSLSGVLDLTRGFRLDVGGGTIGQLMGGGPDQVPGHYRLGDPTLMVPAKSQVTAIRGRDDDVVPLRQTTSYVDAARTSGGEATYLPVPGDHFTIIDPKHESWSSTVTALTALG